jgi:site-specific recombinase XerD
MNAGRTSKVFKLYFPPEQMIEVERKATCNSMSNSVAAGGKPAAMDMHRRNLPATGYRPVSLYTPVGARKYVNLSERSLLTERLRHLPVKRRLLAFAIMWTGARVSEVLAITPSSFQIDAGLVAIQTLKRRQPLVREIPIPSPFMAELDAVFDLRRAQRDPEAACRPLWDFHRVTVWRMIKQAMEQAGISGVRATPRGLRHAFGVGTLAAGVPLTLVQRLLGHASVATTAIYTEVVGPEQRALTARFWQSAF